MPTTFSITLDDDETEMQERVRTALAGISGVSEDRYESLKPHRGYVGELIREEDPHADTSYVKITGVYDFISDIPDDKDPQATFEALVDDYIETRQEIDASVARGDATFNRRQINRMWRLVWIAFGALVVTNLAWVGLLTTATFLNRP